MFRQFYDNEGKEGPDAVVEKPVPWYTVIQVKDIIYVLLFFSISLVVLHVFYHQQQEIDVLQNRMDLLTKVLQYMQHFVTQQ